MRKHIAAALLALAVCVPAAHSQTSSPYPNRPVTMVIPYPAGGPTDAIGRVLAVKLGTRLAQPVIVENRAGAGANIGAEYVAKATPDGYTLLFATSPALAINTSLYKGLKYDPLTSFEPLVYVGSLPNVLIVHPSVQATNVAELVALSKSKPGGLSYASAGNGGTSHLAGVMFAQQSGAQLTHIPHKGTAPALQSLLGGHTDMSFTDVLTALPYIQSGKVRVLGVTSAQPSHVLPASKPLNSLGLRDYDVSVFFALVAPKGLPAAVRSRLSADLQQVLVDPEVQQQLRGQGLQISTQLTPEYLGEVMRREVIQWRKIIQESGAKPD
ncbi:MAG: tripartite tricarboxylate transporter substrate binding protein [Hyphomicrobiales bacterium]|nr:MAG: tripartite tricarboxylate transporter substrate binding protein [Hyphomicrobiales bacterium]